jgi:mannosyltransferase OCH1-like enzyme
MGVLNPHPLRLQVIQAPAAKADIWRLAVILRYGGVYADSDVKALHPFRERVWANASVVSGMGSGKDLHQW